MIGVRFLPAAEMELLKDGDCTDTHNHTLETQKSTAAKSFVTAAAAATTADVIAAVLCAVMRNLGAAMAMP